MDSQNESLFAPEWRRRNCACIDGIGPLFASLVDSYANLTHVYVAERSEHSPGGHTDHDVTVPFPGYAHSRVIGLYRTKIEAMAELRKEIAEDHDCLGNG